MKYLLYIIIIGLLLVNCNSTKKTIITSPDEFSEATKLSDTVKIVNEEQEYEIIIIDPGFSRFLYGSARQRGYYTQTFLENRNIIYVNEWNRRAQQPFNFDPNLYELQINYYNNIDYGYEVNYLLYNYFIYFQLKYNQRLGPFTPRI